MKIKVNDNVKVLSGKDRAKTGKVTQVFAQNGKIVVDGINKIKKHLRAKSQTEKGQVLELFAPLFASKVALICPRCQKPTRVGYKLDGDKKKRVCRACSEFID